MKKHFKLFKTNKNMRDYKFFIYSELSKECFGLYKTYLRCADSYVGIMFCLKSAAALSVMTMLGITSIPTSDDETHRLIQKFKADYPEAYNENQDIINAYYAIRDIVNSYINDSRNVDYEQNFSSALEIYTKFFGNFIVFDNFTDFSKHTADKYNYCEGFDRISFAKLCKTEKVDEFKFMTLTFQDSFRAPLMKVLCS